MDEIFVEGVRCFYTRQSAPLRPITFLVGENSTGKTTFLALTRIAWDLSQGWQLLDLNEEPFQLGEYDDVASYPGGKGGRVKSFTIGARAPVPNDLVRKSPWPLADRLTVTGRFRPKDGTPTLEHWVLDASPFRLEAAYPEGTPYPDMTITTPSGTLTTPVSMPPKGPPAPGIPGLLYMMPVALLLGKPLGVDNWPQAKGEIRSQQDVHFVLQLFTISPGFFGPRPYAFAPIRTRPQRTYDPIKDVPAPEGSHVPTILAKTFSSSPDAWNRLRESLDSFGKKSGLFRDMSVRRMRQKLGGPFQITVTISGPRRNLVDVGYGVSQILPIIVDSLGGEKGSTFLLQQPEVHLHPKAQAELASFLAFQAKHQGQRFLIETHSDYLLDRVRADVRRDGLVKPDDVSILYFERQDGGVKIHSLEIDRRGNIVNAPPGYRQFFLDEDRRLLGG